MAGKRWVESMTILISDCWHRRKLIFPATVLPAGKFSVMRSFYDSASFNCPSVPCPTQAPPEKRTSGHAACVWSLHIRTQQIIATWCLVLRAKSFYCCIVGGGTSGGTSVRVDFAPCFARVRRGLPLCVCVGEGGSRKVLRLNQGMVQLHSRHEKEAHS